MGYSPAYHPPPSLFHFFRQNFNHSPSGGATSSRIRTASYLLDPTLLQKLLSLRCRTHRRVDENTDASGNLNPRKNAPKKHPKFPKLEKVKKNIWTKKPSKPPWTFGFQNVGKSFSSLCARITTWFPRTKIQWDQRLIFGLQPETMIGDYVHNVTSTLNGVKLWGFCWGLSLTWFEMLGKS